MPSNDPIADLLSGGAAAPQAAAPSDPITAALMGGQQQQQAGGGLGMDLLRALPQFASGFNHSLTEGLGGPLDLVGRSMSALGVPGIQPHFFASGLQSLMEKLTGKLAEPQGTLQNAAFGAGQGVGNAASVFMPATAISQGAKAGSMLGGVADALSSAPGLQMASGMAQGGTQQATGSPLAGLAAGMVPLAPSMLAAGARGVAGMGAAPITPEQSRLMDVAKQNEIPLSAAQQLNSRPLKTIESIFTKLPMTAGAQAQEVGNQQQAFTRAFMTRAGNPQDFASPEILQATKADLGGKIGDIVERNNMQVTPDVMQSVKQFAENLKFLPPDQAKPVQARVGQFLDAVGQLDLNKPQTQTFPSGATFGPPPTPFRAAQQQTAVVPGQFYANLDSALGRQIRGTQDGNAREALTGFRQMLRGAMDQSISPEDAAQWQQLRGQYATLQQVAQAMNQPSAMSAAGNISPAAIANAVNNRAMKSNAFGYGNNRDLAAVGKAFIQDAIPSSETSERSYLTHLLTHGLPALAGAMLGSSEGAGAGLGAAAAGLMAPKAAQMIWNSPATQQMFTQPGAFAGGGLLSSLLAQQARAQSGKGGLLENDPTTQAILQLSR